MQFNVLGPLRVVTCSGELVPVPSGRASQTLCWLIAGANEPIALETLATAVFPAEDAASAQQRIQQLVRLLARHLEPGTLLVRPAAQLRVPEEDIDAHRFEHLVRRARESRAGNDPSAALQHYRAALALWRGDPFRELERAPQAIPVIDRLVELHWSALEESTAIRLEDDILSYELVADLAAWLTREPTRPRLRRHLAQVLYRHGRQVEALGVLDSVGNEFDDFDDLRTAILRRDVQLFSGEFTAAGRSR